MLLAHSMQRQPGQCLHEMHASLGSVYTLQREAGGQLWGALLALAALPVLLRARLRLLYLHAIMLKEIHRLG